MTEKQKNNSDIVSENFKKLSIQVSLNGLSFCVLDTVTQKILNSGTVNFKSPSTPYLVKKELRLLLEENEIHQQRFTEIIVVHKNNVFSLVPKDLFREDELPNYLKLNTKLLPNDQVVYDELAPLDIMNVYVPLTNVNNFLFELFGEFEFKHSGTVLIQSLMGQKNLGKEPVCYGHVTKSVLELVILKNNRLLFYNQFVYHSKEDFLYYVLFTFEQLALSTETTRLKLFGAVEEDDAIFTICYRYIEHVSVFVPAGLSFLTETQDKDSIDLTILSAL